MHPFNAPQKENDDGNAMVLFFFLYLFTISFHILLQTWRVCDAGT